MTFHRWIIDNLPRGAHVLELGSGIGTGWLSKHFYVTSVEHDQRWLDLVADADYIHAPLVGDWYDLEVLAADLPTDYDLLLVDGPPEDDRRAQFGAHAGMFRNDVPWLVDDLQRPATWAMFDNVAPGRQREVFAEPRKTQFGVIYDG